MTGSRFSHMVSQLLTGERQADASLLREYEPAIRREIRFALLQIQLAEEDSAKVREAALNHRRLQALLSRIENRKTIEDTDE